MSGSSKRSVLQAFQRAKLYQKRVDSQTNNGGEEEEEDDEEEEEEEEELES